MAIDKGNISYVSMASHQRSPRVGEVNCDWDGWEVMRGFASLEWHGLPMLSESNCTFEQE